MCTRVRAAAVAAACAAAVPAAAAGGGSSRSGEKEALFLPEFYLIDGESSLLIMCFCFNKLRRLGDLCALIHTAASIEERCVLTNSRTVVLSQSGRPGGPRPGADHRGLTETRETRETETETETGREGEGEGGVAPCT